MAECLVFAQGQIATITATFVTTSGMPVNVPDATIEIFGPSADVILPATAMSNTVPGVGSLPTGLFYYDYVIPLTMPVNTYTIYITGTVLGVPTAMSVYLQVLPAGSPTPASASQKAIGLVAALADRYLECAMHVAVNRELGRKNRDGTKVTFSWPYWNLSNHTIFLNDEQIETGYTIDLDTAVVTFDIPLHETDRVDASYNFRMYTQNQLLGYISDAIGQINAEPPQDRAYTVDTFPDTFVGILMQGAAANALQKMLWCINFQPTQTIFGGGEFAQNASNNFRALKENFEKRFTEDKKTLKTKGPYPKISAIVQPEYTLPGGRSRWFRYLFSTNA